MTDDEKNTSVELGESGGSSGSGASSGNGGNGGNGADVPGGPAPGKNAPGGRTPRELLRGRSELGVCLLLLVLGVLVLTDALTMADAFTQRGPVGPATVPVIVGGALLLVAVALAVDVLRGGRGEAEGGEDIDLTAPGDWRTVLLLAGVFLGNAVLIEPLGFPVSGALLFWGSAYALGSRNPARDPLIAAALSVLTFLVFNNLLGVPLPGGPLMGVL
ncbi:hypothetical protein CRI70_04735 [Streptomyces sp. Ru87]|nr:hypothetical protein CRI70_04735 [Streptomyces sp. Ru87]